MKKSRLQIFLVVGLLALLGVLAALQYVWLGQISDAERERLQRVVKSDTERFAEDFNREINNAYFNFQTGAETWREKNFAEFNERYKFWQSKTAYRDLIKNIYFTETGADKPLLRYDAARGDFAPADWTEKLAALKPPAAESSQKNIFGDIPALILPIHETPAKIDRIIVSTPPPAGEKMPPVEVLKKYGALIIELDAEVIKNRLLPDLAKKYFGEADDAEFKLAVTDQNNQPVYQTAEVGSGDASAKIFNLAPDNFIFFANRDLISRSPGEKRSVVLSTSTVERKTAEPASVNTNSRVELKVMNGEQPSRFRVFESGDRSPEGVWTLSVRHRAGSLEQFVSGTRRKNLGISFGILGLLAVSVVLIFVSAQRAKMLAQRQIDFVSSVSHEFRTPLAVIYSAGENLADGVAREGAQVSRYGSLIKAEGKKLSGMVEQILEFAGANAGRKKYDFRETEIKEVVENALAECRALIDEKGFRVETDVAENLPRLRADKTALTQAIQNLIANSLKYSNGEKYLKISARNGGERLKIAVEDRGIGIAPPDLKHIFEPFYRAKAVVDEQIHGSGLGLSIVRETVKAHGGEIRAESEVGKGSKFTIELPLKEL